MARLYLLPLAVAACLGGMEVSSAASEPQPRGYYSGQRMANAKENLRLHDWARTEKENLLARANRWVAYEDEYLQSLIAPPEIPRAFMVHMSGSPAAGALPRGHYSWEISPDRPWRVVCPVSGEEYPSNDFSAYLDSGMEDTSLLTGEYPDDGWGWESDDHEKKFWFVAYYAHWIFREHLLPAIEDLSKAYLLTGNDKYAHKCAVLLWQLAEYYPDYNYESQSRYGTEFQPDYLGRFLYATWEAHFTAQVIPPAYDAIRPYLEKEDSPLLRMTGQSSNEVRSHIENRLLLTMVDDIMNGTGRILGNFGMHQVALLRLAGALAHRDDADTSAMVEWVVSNHPPGGKAAVMGVEHALYNLIQRDGYAFESPAYNVLWTDALIEIARELDGHGHDLSQHPRFQRIFYWPLRLAAAGEMTPALGDSGNLFSPVFGFTPNILGAGLRFTGDPAFARAMKQHGVSAPRNLFEPYFGDDIVERSREHPRPIGIESEIMPALGYATLQTGTEKNRTAVSAFYGRYFGHAHFERLHIDFFSNGQSLLPDFGYPETATFYDARRWGFFSHTVSHNTVMVDARRQKADWGRLHAFDPGERVQVLDVSAERVYPEDTEIYRRTLMLVDVAPGQAYLVDIFRVRGGRQHDWIVHGTEAAFETDLPLSPPRTEGTLAGPDVAYGDFYDDPALASADAATPLYGYEGSGFQFLYNVREAPLDGMARLEWEVTRPPPQRAEQATDVNLRAHLLGSNETVFICDGRPQELDALPDEVTFAVRRRTAEEANRSLAENPLESVFVTVFEPYQNKPLIRNVRLLPSEKDNTAANGLPVALEIELEDGRSDILFSRIAESSWQTKIQTSKGTFETDGRAAALSFSGSELTHAYLLDGAQARLGDFHLDGKPRQTAVIHSVCRETGRIQLEDPIDDRHPPAGNAATVQSPDAIDGEGYEDTIPVRRIVDSGALQADDDLTVARARVREIRGERLYIKPIDAPFARAGMSVVDETGDILGRLKKRSPDVWTLDHPVPEQKYSHSSNADGHLTVYVLAAGPGDQIDISRSLRWQKP